jgi:AAHS family 4-hydroxybenzoate transporter-like MFS transporter
MTPPPEKPVDIAPLLDEGRWTPYLKFVVFLTALAIVFDGADIQLLGLAIPSMMQEWGLQRSAFASLFATGMVGMMVGGASAGLVGDRFGRKTALIGSVSIFALATLAMAAVSGVMSLGLLRFLAGVGLGGAMPNAAALACEYVPRRQRHVAVTLTIVCVPLGGMLAAYAAGTILPALGWRGLFVVGGVAPLIFGVLLIFLLPESPRFLARHPRRWPELAQLLRRAGYDVSPAAGFADSSEQSGVRGSLGALFVPEFRRDTLALWGAFVSCLLAVYTCFNWLPTLLAGAGLNGSDGLLKFNLGGVFGALGGGFLISRLGSRPVMLAMAGAAVGVAFALGTMAVNAGAASTITILLILLGGLINAVQTTMYGLAAHAYPAAIRATGVGSAVSFGRLGGILSSYAGAWALQGGTSLYFNFLAGSMAVSFAALAIVARHVPRAQRGANVN